MKLINFSCIVNDFIHALLRNSSYRGALFAFFAIPFCLGIAAYVTNWKIDGNQLSSLISVFAIFAALLFAAQISSYSIYENLLATERRHLDSEEEDEILKSALEQRYKNRSSELSIAFRDINAGISYLILVSIALLVIVLGMIFWGTSSRLATSILASMSAHLLLILIMVVKQCHLVFDAAYAGNNDHEGRD
ncbi:hypothetical protein [Antarctobacter jejuensis]|uniref:hypothetical protein n=1 Tax=Antarctobacter jejuensis TaxID=1439938 RepID=UPI003FD657FC